MRRGMNEIVGRKARHEQDARAEQQRNDGGKNPCREQGGGRYRTGDGGGEDATGFTLYTDTILQALPAPPTPRRIYVPFDAESAAPKRLRAEGWITVAGLATVRDPRDEAKRLNCGHLLDGGKIVALT